MERFRTRQRAIGVTALVLLFIVLPAVTPLGADVILSAPELNATLKRMERLRRDVDAGRTGTRGDAVLDLGTEAVDLAALVNKEIESHGMQEKALVDLTLSRMRDLGLAVVYNDEKRQYFYDGALFSQYLAEEPRGKRAMEAQFRILENDFHRSDTSDEKEITAQIARKRRFLAAHPRFEGGVDVYVWLAIDYRDLAQLRARAGDEAGYRRNVDLARQQLRSVRRKFPEAEQAQIAAQMLRRIDAEVAARRR